MIFALSYLVTLTLALSLAKISGKFSEIERAREDRELIQTLLSQE